MKLKDRVAVVTGAGGHLGRAIALVLAGKGAKVVANDAHLRMASETADMIAAAGGESIAHGADVTKRLEVGEMIGQAVDRWGRLDILVNNAGGPRDAKLTRMTDEDWDFVIDLNLKGSFVCARAAAPHT
jgi:3-oxoacyl-[acyl-carrier protein] reductase